MARKILLVEDSDATREKLKAKLISLGYEVFEATDGLKGLEFIRSHQKEIDLMILDQNMPNLTGLEMLETATQENLVIPTTIILTTEVEVSHREQADKLGVLAWLVKPVDFDRIANSVETAIQMS